MWTIESLTEAPASSKHKLVVVLSRVRNGRTQRRTIAFGRKGYGHNYSDPARKNYLRRSAGIRNKAGEQTKDDPLSKNYWSRRVLWESDTTYPGILNPEIAQREARVQRFQQRKQAA